MTIRTRLLRADGVAVAARSVYGWARHNILDLTGIATGSEPKETGLIVDPYGRLLVTASPEESAVVPGLTNSGEAAEADVTFFRLQLADDTATAAARLPCHSEVSHDIPVWVEMMAPVEWYIIWGPIGVAEPDPAEYQGSGVNEDRQCKRVPANFPYRRFIHGPMQDEQGGGVERMYYRVIQQSGDTALLDVEITTRPDLSGGPYARFNQ